MARSSNPWRRRRNRRRHLLPTRLRRPCRRRRARRPNRPRPNSLPRRRESSPIDLLGEDALEADVLDDDAFFATLREAVHDDTPLGPREEGDDNLDFFDDGGDRSGFRDVFRRRR